MAPSSTETTTGGRQPPGGAPQVVPLNDAATTFTVLAAEIRGAAAGWSPGAVDELEARLLEAYGPILGGDRAVRQLVEIATAASAA